MSPTSRNTDDSSLTPKAVGLLTFAFVVDMGAPGVATCHECYNSMKWDESKFGIIRVYGWNERLKPSQVSDFFHIMRLKKRGDL